MSTTQVPRQRAIIDRRRLASEIGSLVEEHGEQARGPVVQLLKTALDKGRAELESRLEAKPSAGHENAGGFAFLIDQLIRVIHDHATTHLYPSANRSQAERLTVIAVGGYGRAEMSPHSDVDVAFLVGGKKTAWCEQVVEAMLYLLWDLGLKVGHSTRTLDEAMRLSKNDLTIRTALLEGRYVWGDQELFEEGSRRFTAEVVQGNQRNFVTEKLAERNARHKRMGDSRYVVEPNVKDGKGGLRDLHTLYWIGKFIHRVRTASELVDVGLFTPAEYRSFRRAENFLLAVRSHMHVITGRAEDRLTFDLQRRIAERMNFAERPGKSSVERFMQFYFLQAKRVGSLTGVFLAHIDDQFEAKTARRGFFAGWKQKARQLKGYRVFGGKIAAPSDDWFKKDPVRLIEIFQLAEAEELEIHPETMRQADRDSGAIDNAVREDPRAN
ncbi:MAG TPA: bifunctional uridylyltransferase/uridylyl-removing protein, partial [Erythrobacter sp.]|nr:bifunctional uridylyltransferase/uridylyl-removing protein [Erythrobacter sp.]